MTNFWPWHLPHVAGMLVWEVGAAGSDDGRMEWAFPPWQSMQCAANVSPALTATPCLLACQAACWSEWQMPHLTGFGADSCGTALMSAWQSVQLSEPWIEASYFLGSTLIGTLFPPTSFVIV